jgi:DNA-binding NarL/FixJ family response regulator
MAMKSIPMAIRVVVADDHPIIREGLRSLIAQHADLDLVGTVEDGHHLLAALDQLRPQVVVLDLRMPQLGGLEVLRRLRGLSHPPQIVIFSSYQEPDIVLAAIEAGARAYLLKSSDHGSIIAAIRAAAAGEQTISPALVGTLFQVIEQHAQQRARQDAGLDAIALEVLRQLARGSTNSEIAAALHWSEVTVKRRIQDILAALQVRNRTQAVVEALRRGLL